MLLSMYAFLRWLDTRENWLLAVCSLVNLVCLYTHYVAALVMVTQGVILLLARPIRWKNVFVFGAAQTVVGLALLPWLLRVGNSLERVIAPKDSTTVDAVSVLARTWIEFSVGRTLAPTLSLYLAMVPLFLALAGLFSLFDTRESPPSRRPRKQFKAGQDGILPCFSAGTDRLGRCVLPLHHGLTALGTAADDLLPVRLAVRLNGFPLDRVAAGGADGVHQPAIDARRNDPRHGGQDEEKVEENLDADRGHKEVQIDRNEHADGKDYPSNQ